MGVIIGMDPHKSSATIEVFDECGLVLSKGRVLQPIECSMPPRVRGLCRCG